MSGVTVTCGVEGSNRCTNIRPILNSSTKRLVAAFLHAHPYTFDHLAGLSQRLSLPVEILAPALEELAHDELLIKMGRGEGALYSLNRDAELMNALNQYITTHPREPLKIAKLFAKLL